MTKDSAKILLEEYTKLRANDVTSKKTAYRITVRQLESIIRLSEALAKVHADDLIRGDYVREASRLLSKSIIFKYNEFKHINNFNWFKMLII